MSKQSPKHAVLFRSAIRAGTRWASVPLIAILLMGASCEQQATDARAKLADERIAAQICTVWTPITDTTSSQVRAMNRARFAFCEPQTEKIR